MKIIRLLAVTILVSCISKSALAVVTITAKNELNIAREFESIVIPWSDVTPLVGKTKPDHLIVKDSTGKLVVVQPIFFHGQGKPADELIFQSSFVANESKTFTISTGTPEPYDPKVYGRWVPERLDDFAWENDRIAFRAYGPKLEIAEPASSGIDVWCKRTPNLVINKWYQLADSINGGYYHADHGEGLDGYHVGHGQGCGGTALWSNGKRFTTGTKGWKTQRILANGPIRIVFELTYDPIDINGIRTSETKRITLDAGQNFNRMESTFSTDQPDADLAVAIGISKHDRPGTQSLHKNEGWMTYWDACDSSSLAKDNGNIGCAVVVDPKLLTDMVIAENHLLALATTRTHNKLIFWTGAGWDRSGDFTSMQDWDNYVQRWSQRIRSPLHVTISESR